jgi:hypothetical protein
MHGSGFLQPDSVGEKHQRERIESMTPATRVDSGCRKCQAVPKLRVTRAESHRLPGSWRPIHDHPTLRPGPWVPRGDMKGVVFCESCRTLWFLFLDPSQYYYTDVIEMAPELSALVSENATLEEVLPFAISADSLLQLMIRDWFALADYDPSEAAEALVAELARPDLPIWLALRLLDFLAAVLAGTGRRRRVVVEDASPLVALGARQDFQSMEEVRSASELNEVARLVAGIARSAFGSAFGSDHDRMQTAPSARESLIALARDRGFGRQVPVLAAPGAAPRQRAHHGVEQLVSEIEELLREGVSRLTSQEIRPIVDVVRGFWEVDRDSSFAPPESPGLGLYQRCRDLLFSLRQADLVPRESARSVDEALVAS